MVPTEEFVKKIEIYYLHLIVDLLKSGKTDIKTAKGSAQLLISYKPYHDETDIKMKIGNLKEIYPAVQPLYSYLLHEIEIENTKDVLEKMRKLIHTMKNDDVEDALQMGTK